MIDWVPLEWLGWVLLASILGAAACFGLVLYFSLAPKKRAGNLDPEVQAMLKSNQELVDSLRTYLENQVVITKSQVQIKSHGSKQKHHK